MRVSKRPFVFLQRNTKFYSSTQTVIRFLQRNTKFYSCAQTTIRFLQRNTKFYSCTQTAIRFLQRNTKFYALTAFRFFTAKCKILKTVPKQPFVFHSKIRNLVMYPNCHSFFEYKTRIF